MKTQLTFDQAFYGNDRSGYQMLGNSNPAYSSVIERICCSIGTPDGFSEVSPFLISTTSGGMLIMICCRMGAPDSSNRKTMFFHALYASQTLCEKNGVNAFRIFRAGKFVKSPETDCKRIMIEFDPVDNKPDSLPPFSWNGEKLALITKAPANERMESLLKDKVNRVSWASFTFAPLSDFKLYAISEYVSSPDDRVCCDANGKVLYQPDEKHIKSDIKHPSQNHGNTMQPKKSSHSIALIGTLLVISVSLNIILIAKPDLLSGSNDTNPTENSTRPQSLSSTKDIDPVLKLRNAFIEENRIDWEKESSKKDNRIFFDKLGDPATPEHSFFSKLEYYVKYLNQNILTNPEEAFK